MRREYDFRNGKRGAVVPVPPGQTRITIRLDDDLLDMLRARVHAAGGGEYQVLINEAVREYVQRRPKRAVGTKRQASRGNAFRRSTAKGEQGE